MQIYVYTPQKMAVPEIQQVFLSASEISEQKIMSLKLFNKNKSILRFFIDELRSLISFLHSTATYFCTSLKDADLFPHSIQQCMLLSDIEFYLSYTNVIQAATLLMLNVKYERVS